jgi:hypothetical protein
MILKIYLFGKHILPNRLNGEEDLRFLSDTLPEFLSEVPLDIMQHARNVVLWRARLDSSGTKTTLKAERWIA